MQAHAKSLNERFRTLISLIFGLAIGCSLLFGESRWETSPLIEESLMLLACFMAGIGAFGRIWCSLYIAGYKNNVLVTDGPYSMCRNPLYFFSFVGGIGVSCATETFTIPCLRRWRSESTTRPSSERNRKGSSPFSETPTGTIAGTFPPSFPPSHGSNRRRPPTPSIPPRSRTTLWMRCGSSGSSASLNSSAGFMKPECFPYGSSFRNRLFSPGIQKPRKRPLGNHFTER